MKFFVSRDGFIRLTRWNFSSHETVSFVSRDEISRPTRRILPPRVSSDSTLTPHFFLCIPLFIGVWIGEGKREGRVRVEVTLTLFFAGDLIVKHWYTVLKRDIYGAWTGYIRCLDGIYAVREPSISRPRTAYMWCKHHLYAVKTWDLWQRDNAG